MKEFQRIAKKKSPLYWKNNLGEKVRRVGTLQGGEENAGEERLTVT